MAYTKLTPEVQKELVECIELGMYYKLACESVSISEGTFWRWMQEGKVEETQEKKEFYEAIKKAKNVCAKNSLAAIKSHTVKEWTAAAWLLERRYRKYYGKDAKDLREVVRLIKLLSQGDIQNVEAIGEEKNEVS